MMILIWWSTFSWCKVQSKVTFFCKWPSNTYQSSSSINLCDILLWFDLLARICALSNVTPKGILIAICSDIVNVFKKKVLIIRDLLWLMCILKGQTGKFKFLERFFSNFKHCLFFWIFLLHMKYGVFVGWDSPFASAPSEIYYSIHW